MDLYILWGMFNSCSGASEYFGSLLKEPLVLPVVLFFKMHTMLIWMRSQVLNVCDDPMDKRWMYEAFLAVE